MSQLQLTECISEANKVDDVNNFIKHKMLNMRGLFY